MKSSIVFIFFFTIIASAQEELIIQIKDSPINASLFYNMKLSNRLTLQNGLSIRKNIDFSTFEIPILMKYDSSNEWSTFFGLHARTVINSNYPEFFSNSKKPSDSYFLIGTETKFKNDATGNFTVGFPLDFQLSIKF